MIKGTFTPPPTKTIKLWAGMYGGHYDIIVLFREKPQSRCDRHGNDEDDGKYVNTYENRDLIFADMGIGYFEQWFPDAWEQIAKSRYVQSADYPRPNDIYILYEDLFEIELTVPVDDNGDIIDFNVHVDWPY